MNLIQTAIINTLCYADVFNFPLKQSEIFTYLIWEVNSPSPKIKDLIPELFHLTKTGAISQAKGYFHLPHRHDLIITRNRRRQISQHKVDLARQHIQSITSHPNILGIFLTGALAMNNAEDSDDIDIMMITQANKLWTTRLSTILQLQLHNHRRSSLHLPYIIKKRVDNYSNLLCTNMFLDETALTIPSSKQNLYTAHEVAQAKPLIDKDNLHQRFLSANSWIHHFLPHIPIPSVSLHTSSFIPHTSFFESLTFRLQYAYMKHKITREIISPHTAFFHPRDTSGNILNQYYSRVKLVS